MPHLICYNATGCKNMMSKEKIKTIEDIARLANVSKSTVSRSLNDSPLVKQETKERIQAIAREHQFRVNQPARNLSMRQSYTIAYVTHAYYKSSFWAEDQFGLEIMGGITNGLHALGYELLVVHVDPEDTEWVQQYLNSGRVDGFIIMTSTHKRSYIRTLTKMDAPFIVWGIPGSEYNCCSVSGDNVTGGRLATQHLVQIGRQQIGFIGGPEDDMEVKNRFKGYRLALEAVGRSVDQSMVVYGDFTHSSGIAAMEQLLEQRPDVDAVFVNSDLMAIAAIDVIQNQGKSVPQDIAVVGYDDLAIAKYNNLPLTTVRQNIPLAGKLLAQNLIEYLKNGVITNVTTPVELVVRESA
jgi:DNA-binding LacI/PurR family transcriptional regulator